MWSCPRLFAQRVRELPRPWVCGLLYSASNPASGSRMMSATPIVGVRWGNFLYTSDLGLPDSSFDASVRKLDNCTTGAGNGLGRDRVESTGEQRPLFRPATREGRE